MPFFNVLLHGTGIDMPSADGTPSIIGFYRAQAVHAATPAEASAKAVARVAAEWDSPPYVIHNKGAKPALAVDKVTRISLRDRLRRRNRGYTFYATDDGGSSLPP